MSIATAIVAAGQEAQAEKSLRYLQGQVAEMESKMGGEFARGCKLTGDKTVYQLRWVGEQSYSRYAGLTLGNLGTEEIQVLWDWLAAPRQLEKLDALLVAECQNNPRATAADLARVRKYADGNRSLLMPSNPNRWGLLQAVAARLYAHATALHPGASDAEQHLLRLGACWAWCARCTG